MAIAEMSVMTLVGLTSEKSVILDTVQKTGAVHIKSCREYAFADHSVAPDTGGIAAERERAEKAAETVCSAVDELPKAEKPTVVKDGFGITKAEFFAMEDRREEMLAVIAATEELTKLRALIKAEMTAAEAEKKTYEPYLGVAEKFSFYLGGKKFASYLGTVASERAAKLVAAAAEEGFVAEELGAGAGERAVALVAFGGDRQRAEELLSSYGFRRCPFTGDFTAREKIDELDGKTARLAAETSDVRRELAAMAPAVRDLRLYADYLAFCEEKANAEGGFGKTRAAFVMEAYVPTEAADKVKEEIGEAASAIFTEFEVVPREEFAPTLEKNGKAVRNFEAVTDMYSAPAYGALDPNAVMSFFFSLFMGVIMADVGYGLLMIAGGFLFAAKQREGSSIARMARVFAFGGFFAVIFGALFDGWLGYPLLRTVFGEGSAYNAFYAAHLDSIKSMTTIAGISVPSVLMWCLALGTLQIAVGLVLKAVQDFSRKKYLDGIFGGVVWAVGLVSLVVWIYGTATSSAALSEYGMYVTAGFIGVGVLTAGITEKGVGKIVKIFTSAYGLINYVSDILSYARLYGLMLAGAQIASIFTNDLAINMLFPLGIGGIAAGVLLIIVGNLFNLAINLLGAYIHDARLQYVEFYGKFYEGEGEPFKPFGRNGAHTYFKA